MEKLHFCRETPLRYETDVLVAGGGPAGCAAAVTAARNGARVLLVDANGCFGGLGTAGMVPAFMRFGDAKAPCADGFGRELAQRLLREGGPTTGEFPMGFSIRTEVLKRVYDDLLDEAGVQRLLYTQVIGLQMEGGKIGHVVLHGKSGLYAARARCYIDGTGDADLAFWAGAPTVTGDENGAVMAATLCCLYTGLDWTKADHHGQNQKMREAYEDGLFDTLDLHLPGFWQLGESMGGGNIGHAFNLDPLDEASLTQAVTDSRRLLLKYETYYKKYLQGYENMEMAATAPLLGVRESRRIIGDYVLTLDDYLARAVFGDEIGRFNYPVDIHAANQSMEAYEAYHKGITTYRCPEGENYGIPYRTLLPQGVDNLLVAGRSISTDRAVQSSARVMPCCYITGQAAGLAAALCARDGCTPRQLPVQALQKQLLEMGAYLPNCGSHQTLADTGKGGKL